MTAAARLAKTRLDVEAAPAELSTVDIEHLDRLAAIVRLSKDRHEDAIKALTGLRGAASFELTCEAVDHLERTSSIYEADARAFFCVWEQIRGRR